MCVQLRIKCQVSSIILTNFKQVVIFPLPQNKTLKSPPRLGLKRLLKELKYESYPKHMKVTQSIKSEIPELNLLIVFQ